MTNFKILIIDDDPKLGNLLKDYLGSFHHEVDYLTDATKCIDQLVKKAYDLAILDIMMPDIDGFELCKEIRKTNDIPILFLSARGETTDKIIGLELGADDYLPKPFEPRELMARINSILRRNKKSSSNNSDTNGKLVLGDLELDEKSLTAKLASNDLDLTSNEFLALNYLAKNSDKIVSRDELLTFLQGFDTEVFGRSIDILVSRLRSKLNDDPKKPKFIKTIRGQGYRFIGGLNEKA